MPAFNRSSELTARLREATELSKVYVPPPPNEFAYGVAQLRYGRRDWQPDIDDWQKANRRKIEKAVRKRKYIDYRRELGMAVTDHVFIHEDPHAQHPHAKPPTKAYIDFASRSLWRPDVFENLLLSDGRILAATMSTVKAGCDLGSILRLADKVQKLFEDTFIEIEDKVIAEHPAMKLPWPALGDWGRATTLLRTGGKLIIAKFLLGLYFIETDVWNENVASIAEHIPSDTASYLNTVNETADGLPDMALDDSPAKSAEALVTVLDDRNRRASGSSIAPLSTMDGLLED